MMRKKVEEVDTRQEAYVVHQVMLSWSDVDNLGSVGDLMVVLVKMRDE